MSVTQFPELRYVQQCGLCRLAKHHPNVLRLIHDLRYHQRMGYGGINKAIADLIRPLGVKLHNVSLYRHFREHVDFEREDFLDNVKPSTSAGVLTLERMDFDETALRRLHYEVGSCGREEVDYQEMWNLFNRVMRRVEALDGDPNAFKTDDLKVNYSAIGSWNTLVNSCRQILADLSRMRNSDRMMSLILQRHTTNYGTQLAQPIAEILRDIHKELQRVNANPETVDKVSALLDGGIAEIFSRAAVFTIKQSKKDFKLPSAA